MLSYNAMGTYVLVVTLATVFVIILVARQQRTRKDIAIWLISGLVGIILGAAGVAGIVQALGYEVVKKFVMPPEAEAGGDGEEGGEEGGEGGDTGGGMGMGSGGPGGMGMGRGGGRGPSPKRELTMLVRKVALLTGDISLKLADDQAADLTEVLGRIKSQETMTDEDAGALHKELLGLFNKDQRDKQDAIDLPRGGRGGGPGGRGGSPGGPSGGSPGGPGGGEQNENANPFAEERNAAALDALLKQFGKPAADTTASDAEPKDAEPKDAEPKETTTEKPKTPKE